MVADCVAGCAFGVHDFIRFFGHRFRHPSCLGRGSRLFARSLAKPHAYHCTMGGDEGEWSALFLMLFVTLGGIFIFSALIGVLNSGLESKLDELRKGRSFVVEKDHTIIYGWSSLVFTIVSELIEANQNRKRPAIVILADKDKLEMEDELRAQIEDFKNTRIVCRTGSPIDFHDVQIPNPNAARSIILLAPQDIATPDSHVIKTALALLNNPDRKKEPYHLVAELREEKNRSILEMVSKGEVETVVFDDLVTQLSVQTCRQSGLSVAFMELLNFGGDEIYFKSEPSLTGKTFGEAVAGYETSSVIGLETGQGVQLNPSKDTRIQASDRIIAISKDDDTLVFAPSNFLADASHFCTAQPTLAKPERTLILGWNERTPAIIKELGAYVVEGSEVVVVTEAEQTFENPLSHVKVHLQAGDTTDRHVLEAICPETFDQIMVLRDTEMGVQEADAKTLIVLLHLREIANKHQQNFAIVSEMGDIRNQRLAETTQVDDFIISDRMVSLVLAQLSENKGLARVFEELFNPEGVEMYLKPITDYVRTETSMPYATLVEAALARGEVLIGYKVSAEALNSAASFGIRVNPAKSAQVRFQTGDKAIVLARS